jgi:hypothetical protein
MASLATSRDTRSTSKRVADEAPQPQQVAKKPKKTISVAGLFAKKPRAECEQVTSTDGIMRKPPSAEEILTAKAKRHPIYLDVKSTHHCFLLRANFLIVHTEATTAYTHAEAGSVAEQLEAAHDELSARIDGIDINGKPLNIPGLPSDAALKDMQEDVKLYRPLEEDIVTISNIKSDGTVNFKHVKIGDSIQKLEKLIHDSEVKLTRLDKELDGVNEEIDATLDRYNKATKSVGDAYMEKIKEHQEEAITFHKFTHDEVAKARKEDKAYGVEANRKLQAFVASLI